MEMAIRNDKRLEGLLYTESYNKRQLAPQSKAYYNHEKPRVSGTYKAKLAQFSVWWKRPNQSHDGAALSVFPQLLRWRPPPIMSGPGAAVQ